MQCEGMKCTAKGRSDELTFGCDDTQPIATKEGEDEGMGESTTRRAIRLRSRMEPFRVCGAELKCSCRSKRAIERDCRGVRRDTPIGAT